MSRKELWILRGSMDYVLFTHTSGIFGSFSTRCSHTYTPHQLFRHKPRYCRALDSKVVGNLFMCSSLVLSSDNDLLHFRSEITITMRSVRCVKTREEVAQEHNRV